MIFLWACFGAVSTLRIQVAYIYLMELQPKKYQNLITTVWCIMDHQIYFFAVLYFWKISKHWFYFCSIGYVWNIISVIAIYFLPESPRYLYSVGKHAEASKVFETISKWNGKKVTARSV